jgi:hypothetical protein
MANGLSPWGSGLYMGIRVDVATVSDVPVDSSVAGGDNELWVAVAAGGNIVGVAHETNMPANNTTIAKQVLHFIVNLLM